MRLIDADSIRGCAKHIKTNEKFEPYIMIDDLSKLIDEQPTAYDIDKVVEELKEKARTVNVIAYGNIYEAINKDVAIEIVNQGGVSDDVCEWKLEYDNLMTDCGDYFNLYDNCTDKFKFCPTCGKKIKVV